MRTLPFLRVEDMVIFHVDIFPFFACFFLFVARVCCPLPPPSANTPFLGFFKVFPFRARTSLSPTRISVFWRLIFMPMLSLCRRRGQGEFSGGCGGDGSRSGRFLQPESLLLSVISSCFWRSTRMNKMAACCFYSSDTGGWRAGVGGGIRREWGRERWRGESSWVFGIVRKAVPCSFARCLSVGVSDDLHFLPPWNCGSRICTRCTAEPLRLNVNIQCVRMLACLSALFENTLTLTGVVLLLKNENKLLFTAFKAETIERPTRGANHVITLVAIQIWGSFFH